MWQIFLDISTFVDYSYRQSTNCNFGERRLLLLEQVGSVLLSSVRFGEKIVFYYIVAQR